MRLSLESLRKFPIVVSARSLIYRPSEVAVRDNDCGNWDKKSPSQEKLVSSIGNRTIWTVGPAARAKSRIGAGRMKNFMKTTRLVLTVMTLFAADTNAGTQEQLAAYRQQIDSIDQHIVELFQQRARVVEEVGNIKREAHLPVTVPSREQQVVEKAQELAKGGPLPAEAVGRIYQKLVEEMRNWEAKLDAAAAQSSSQPAAAGGSK
jgi:chorismate mutase